MKPLILFVVLLAGVTAHEALGQISQESNFSPGRTFVNTFSTNSNPDSFTIPNLLISDDQKLGLAKVLFLYSGIVLLTDAIVFTSVLSGQGEFTPDGLIFAGFLGISGIGAAVLGIKFYQDVYSTRNNSTGLSRTLHQEWKMGLVDHGIGLQINF